MNGVTHQRNDWLGIRKYINHTFFWSHFVLGGVFGGIYALGRQGLFDRFIGLPAPHHAQSDILGEGAQAARDVDEAFA